jgi:hypothetical protein
MNVNAIKLVADRASDVAAPLHIVLTYDHPTMANAARKLLAGPLTKCAADVDIHRDEWSFAELEHPQCHSEALELAAGSDVFVIAVSGVEDLPLSFFDWLNDWLEMRHHTETAVILAVGSSNTRIWDLPLFASLLSLPRANGLSFFATTVDLPQTNAAVAKPRSLLARLGCLNNECLPESSGLND